MSETDDFRTAFLPRLVEAEAALHRGDVEPRLALWSRRDPVSLLGAFGPCDSGWDRVSATFRWVASRFSDGTDYDIEFVAIEVGADLAYTVGYERCTVSVDGAPPRPQTVRATQVYRREDGQWRVVHRHGSFMAQD
jgi:ketosteroid isomerase-like protein